MTEVILFPDSEYVLVDALSTRLNVPVSTRVPNPRPAEFVRLVRIGGGDPNLITDRSMVTVEAWAESTPAASNLARLTYAYIYSLAPDTIRNVNTIAGVQSFPDPLSETPRYQFTLQFDMRGTAI